MQKHEKVIIADPIKGIAWACALGVVVWLAVFALVMR
jgi:hypothetical protein